MFRAGQKAELEGHRRGIRWTRRGPQNRRTETRLDRARHRASIAEWDRSRSTNPQALPYSQDTFYEPESSADVVQEALGTGAHGYVVKTDARRELLEAVSAVLRGEQFVGRRFSAHSFIGAPDAVASQGFQTESAVAPLQRSTEIARRHEAGFFSDDANLLDDLTRFMRLLSKPGMRLSLSRPSHTGIALW